MEVTGAMLAVGVAAVAVVVLAVVMVEAVAATAVVIVVVMVEAMAATAVVTVVGSAAVSIAVRERCIRRNAPTAEKTVKCLSSRRKAGQSTARSASKSIDRHETGSETLFHHLFIFFTSGGCGSGAFARLRRSHHGQKAGCLIPQ